VKRELRLADEEIPAVGKVLRHDVAQRRSRVEPAGGLLLPPGLPSLPGVRLVTWTMLAVINSEEQSADAILDTSLTSQAYILVDTSLTSQAYILAVINWCFDYNITR
jgi:hypothetical protein